MFLNVQRPAGNPRGKLLPVMFWIHGGGLLNGSSNQHDGAMFVRQANIVVVTINYRMGLFGFLTHPALTQERGTSGNYGLLDQQAALHWVRDTIAVFGGDPRRITIADESAGAYSVCAHLSAPGSRGMFIGANRDEGRTFVSRTEFVGFTREQYEAYVRGETGSDAAAAERLKRYPWPANADQFTATYLIAAAKTDGALVFGVGGCANLTLTDAFARQTETYAYEFDHRDGPGLEPEPAGYAWGAGHAAELAYLWPNFDNGTPISPTFDAGERQLAREMVRSWGAFVRTGRPGRAGVTPWPSYQGSDSLMSLRAGGRSALVTRDQLATQHQCDYWWPLIESWWPPAG